MNKNLLPKILLILVLIALAVWTLYPPDKTLKPGIDLAGGTSLVYEINTQGLTAEEQRDLAQRMITVLRRRIDPANIQNLIWRPQGNTRFEIQMPLASAETRQKRKTYEKALDQLLAKNVNPSTILRLLKRPAEERDAGFTTLALNDPNRLAILTDLAHIYDQRKSLQEQRTLNARKMAEYEQQFSDMDLNVDLIKQNRVAWEKLDPNELAKTMTDFMGTAGDPNLLSEYVDTYKQWAQSVEPLTNQESGLNQQFIEARRNLDKLNLTVEQLSTLLDQPKESSKRTEDIQKLKDEFPDRAALIDAVVNAYDQYSPYKGQLDDPADLQRMLKGAGILEFRIVPTTENTSLNPDEIDMYVKSLKEKGPTYASDNKYLWCELEDNTQESAAKWAMGLKCIVGEFGGKYYVLASQQPNQTLLHSGTGGDWKLERAYPTSDQYGRRAIGFALNDKGANLFANLTGQNIGKLLCILLDDLAISAPRINSKIYGSGIIEGSFTETEVADMVNKLNAGSLPARLIEQPISVKTIGPSIGEENRDQGIRAGFIGLIAVMVCMLLYYLKAGTIADVALTLNILFVLAIMAGVRATFTLPGIAGIILTIGMSVDANVLIFERIREEQAKGSSIGTAIKNGYEKAFRTILDANLTTFITGAILYWIASEEIKGFAIVLMLGIVSSMFTALFITRVIFDMLLKKRLIKERVVMLSIIHQANINWMGQRPLFFSLSLLLIAGGLVVFFTRDNVKNNKYDIEFTGGTSVQINLKEGVNLTRQDVQDRIRQAAQDKSAALAASNVYSIGNTGNVFGITTTETNKTTVKVTLDAGMPHTPESIVKAIKKAQANSAGRLSNLRVLPGDSPHTYVIITSQVNKTLVSNILSKALPKAQLSEPQVDEVVNNTIKSAFAQELAILQNLQPHITSTEKITEAMIETEPLLTPFLGGIRITCELGQPATAQELDQRIKDLRFKPDLRHLAWYPYQLLSSAMTPLDPNTPVRTFTYVSVSPEAGLRELSAEEWTRFVENETARVENAASFEASLPRVTQIDPSVGGEQKTRALIAIVLSLAAIVTYIWVRFGDLRYGVAAIVALVHDVCITLGAITACAYIASTAAGQALLIGNFKIDLAMIAAFLTLIGYSLNDTIVVFDRIRENRQKAQLTPQTITNSINQTISRTLLTSFTTFIVVLIMYIFGGDGLRGFTFAIGFGVIIGTYSSIAIASPLLLIGAKQTQKK